MQKKLKLILILLLIVPSSLFSQSLIPLHQNWQFRQIGKEDWYSATVPGSVHTDLLSNKLIEDPFFGENEPSTKWIENEDWEYKTAFTADDKLLKNEHIEIVFEGLDTYTSIYLNGKPLLRTDNMFHEWVIDCKKVLKKGENELLLQFFSAVKNAQNKSKKLNYKLPGEEKAFVRKAAFQFGWDFAPRLITSGIFKPVYLKTWNTAIINNIQTIQKTVSKNKASLSFSIEILSEKPLKIDVQLKNINQNVTQNKKAVSLKKGINNIVIDYEIENPKLWWTNGIGESYIYNFSFDLISQKKTICSKSTNFGIRTVELIQEKDSIGTSFYFKLNDISVFIKGANYVPQDVFLSRVDSSKIETLINDVVTSNMNMLRVWGGGIYQDDKFYEICDKKGILIWQDFMFACTMYPGDSSFTESVKKEIIYQIKRLRNHPCVALWCGNNEIEEGWKNWDWQKKYKYSKEDSATINNNYNTLFHTIIPEQLKKLDPQRSYWPSSPKIGWGHAESMKEGDSHYWGVWWGNEPFETYTKKNGRFISEYGFQGMPEMQTLNTFLLSDEKDINSKSLLAHQKFLNGFKTIQTYMDREYRQAKDFEKFVYVSGLLQAYGIKTAIESHRRSKPSCMGTLYWQLNDCWPGITWSGIDYFGRWKPLQYFVKTAFNKVILSVVEENEDIKIYIISDKLQKQIGSLTMKALDFSGKESWKKTFIAEVPANSSKMIYKVKTEDVFSNRHRQKMVFIAELKEKDSLIAKTFFYFTNPKDLKLTKPELAYEIREINGSFIIRLETDNLIKNLYLSIDGDAIFSDNYFDLIPGETTEIICKTTLSLEEIKNKIQVYSLFDSYNSK